MRDSQTWISETARHTWETRPLRAPWPMEENRCQGEVVISRTLAGKASRAMPGESPGVSLGVSRTWNLWGDKRRWESWRRVLGQDGRRITITGLETRGVESYGGRAHLRHRRTAGAGAVGEAQHLSKGMFQLYGGEREPFLQSGQEQKMVGAAIMQRQDREDHIVPFQTTSMLLLYLIGRGIETWKAFGR
jgi:hypothetical protein